MHTISLEQLALGVDSACFVDLQSTPTVPEMAGALTAAQRAQVPVIGLHVGTLPPAMDEMAESLTLTLVERETTTSTVAVADLGVAVGEICDLVTKHPHAAAALVGLLRLTSQVTVEAGLVAESLAYSKLLGGPEFATWRTAVPRRPLLPELGPVVRLEREGDLLILSLQRPHRHNAFSAAVRDELLEGLLVAELVPDLRVLLRGDGPSFCSGGDLDEFGTAADLAAAHRLRISQSAGAAVHRVRDRVTVRLHGSCIGAGIEIPAFAGLVEADSNVRLQLPELRMGLIPGAGGTVSVCRRVGPWRTAYMVLSAAPIDAVTGLRWGLVDRLSAT